MPWQKRDNYHVFQWIIAISCAKRPWQAVFSPNVVEIRSDIRWFGKHRCVNSKSFPLRRWGFKNDPLVIMCLVFHLYNHVYSWDLFHREKTIPSPSVTRTRWCLKCGNMLKITDPLFALVSIEPRMGTSNRSKTPENVLDCWNVIAPSHAVSHSESDKPSYKFINEEAGLLSFCPSS